jgi:hypothetical protein
MPVLEREGRRREEEKVNIHLPNNLAIRLLSIYPGEIKP